MSRVAERVAVGVLLAAAGLLYLWNLGGGGWVNAYYSAAAQAGGTDWAALLYGSTDAGNSITVDKPPASLWLMSMSVRLFGVSPAAVLLPQALLGIATVAVVYAIVRLRFRPGTALLAGVVMAVTPAAALMFRYNNPDALLTFLLAVALYALVRSHDDLRARWLILLGTMFGLAFLTKQLQAFLVLPAFAAVFLWTAAGPVRARLRRAAIVVGSLVVSAGWWVAIVLLVPSGSRPWIGGSPDDSFLTLTFGYNGLGRIFGGDGNGVTGHGGIDRLFAGTSALYIGWLLPAAIALLVLALVRMRGADRRDPVRSLVAALVGGLVSTAVALSAMSGIYHSYYTVAMAPFLAAGVAVGGTLVWRERHRLSSRVWMATIVFGSGCWAFVMLIGGTGVPVPVPWLVLLGAGAATVLFTGMLSTRVLRGATIALAIGALLLGPTTTSIIVASQAHAGSGAGPTTDAKDTSTALGVDPAVSSALAGDGTGYRWVAATSGSPAAARFQLASGYPVMAIGGYKHRDPSPTLPQFQAQVARGDIHWFIGGSAALGAGTGEIARWVGQHFRLQKIGGIAMFDLTDGPSTVLGEVSGT